MRALRACSIVAVSALAVACSASPAPAQSIQCPETIRVRHEVVSKGDWKAIRGEGDHKLASIGLADGPADEGAFLKPTSVRTEKGTRTVTFSFGPDGSDAVWLSCAYEGTSATVTKKIGKAVSTCRVTYTESNGRASAPRLTCQ